MEKDRNSQIFVSNLSPDIREKDLRYKFEKYGDIKNIHLKVGYAFIVELYKNRIIMIIIMQEMLF